MQNYKMFVMEDYDKQKEIIDTVTTKYVEEAMQDTVVREVIDRSEIQ